MTIQRAVLVIADIGGYTKFMKVHRLNLAHAQNTVAILLEAIIDAAQGLALAKLEGDAAFLWAPVRDDAGFKRLTQTLADIRRAFLKRQSTLVLDRLCDCDSCLQIEQLTLKFVAHEGEVALQRVKKLTELAGVDVILVHRMLKNDVPLKEYALMSEALYTRLDGNLQQHAVALEHDFEGLGATQTHYVELDKLMQAAPEEPPKPSFARRWWAKIKMELATLPYLLGLKKPAAAMRNLGAATGLGPSK